MVNWDEGELVTAVPTKDICGWFRLSNVNDVGVLSVGCNDDDILDLLGDVEVGCVPNAELLVCKRVTSNKPFISGSGVERYGVDVICNSPLVAAGYEKRLCDNECGGNEFGLNFGRSFIEFLSQINFA